MDTYHRMPKILGGSVFYGKIQGNLVYFYLIFKKIKPYKSLHWFDNVQKTSQS